MMRALSGDVQLHPTAEGTTVRLRATLEQHSDGASQQIRPPYPDSTALADHSAWPVVNIPMHLQ